MSGAPSHSPRPEFSRTVALDQVARTGDEHIEADAEERIALALRLDLIALDRLEADYTLLQEAAGLLAKGRLRATVSQACIATGEPVADRIDTHFTIRFLPESMESESDELELSADDCDVVFFAGGAIDMGEAVAETLSLSLNPYPRSQDADAFLKQAGVKQEEDMSPFAALKDLKLGKE